MAHNRQTAWHPGGKRFNENNRRYFNWTFLAEDFYQHVMHCVPCTHKMLGICAKTSFMKLLVLQKPFYMIGIEEHQRG
jgi:hypothetical protein